MAVKIFSKSKEKDVFVKLEDDGEDIYLVVVDAEGRDTGTGYMAKITHKGLELCEGFSAPGFENDGTYVNVVKE